MSVEMRNVFNALASRLTPAAAGSPVPSGELLHERVTGEEPTEEQKSDRSSDDTGLRYSNEFNSTERMSRSQRIPHTGILNAEETPPTERLAFEGSSFQRSSRSTNTGREETALDAASNP